MFRSLKDLLGCYLSRIFRSKISNIAELCTFVFQGKRHDTSRRLDIYLFQSDCGFKPLGILYFISVIVSYSMEITFDQLFFFLKKGFI